MTYGEYYYLVKHKMALQDGEWISAKPTHTVPIKMSKEKASAYYSKKFDVYWKNEYKKK